MISSRSRSFTSRYLSMRAAEICEGRSSPKKSRRCPSAHSYCATDLGARRRWRRSSQMEAKTWNVGSGSAARCGRLGRLPISPVHLAHQHLNLRKRLVLRPPFPLAAELDEVLLWPDLEADPERATAAGLLDSQPAGARARHQLARSGAIRLRGATRESSPPQQPHALGKHGGRCRRRAMRRRRREEPIDLAKVKAQPAPLREGRRDGRRCGRPSHRSRRASPAATRSSSRATTPTASGPTRP